jgi:hypothetical protein
MLVELEVVSEDMLALSELWRPLHPVTRSRMAVAAAAALREVVLDTSPSLEKTSRSIHWLYPTREKYETWTRKARLLILIYLLRRVTVDARSPACRPGYQRTDPEAPASGSKNGR